MKLTVRAKIQLLLLVVITSVGIAAIHHARREMERTLGDELEQRGLAIAQDLAVGIADPLLTGDLVAVNEWITRAKAHNKDLRYVLVLGSRRELVASTFGSRIPKGLTRANLPAEGERSRLLRIRTEEGLIRDFAVSSLGGHAGIVRAGLSDASLQAAVDRHSRILALLVALAAIFGLLAACWLASHITEPLRSLAAAVRSVGEGELGREIAPHGDDEVSHLTHAFNATTRALADKERMRRILLEKVITSQESERKRLARDLHDELVQLLTSVRYTLEAASRHCGPGDARTAGALSVAQDAAGKALLETRRLIFDLRPAILDDLGLGPAIRQFARSRFGTDGVRLDVDVAALPAGLDPLVETNVFRIVQEACTNAAKYSRANAVRIAAAVADGMVRGEVEDDGAGFDPETVTRQPAGQGAGLGILGMRERAGLLGGTVTVRSAPGRGTTVSFAIPLGPGEEGLEDGSHKAAAG